MAIYQGYYVPDDVMARARAYASGAATPPAGSTGLFEARRLLSQYVNPSARPAPTLGPKPTRGAGGGLIGPPGRLPRRGGVPGPVRPENVRGGPTGQMNVGVIGPGGATAITQRRLPFRTFAKGGKVKAGTHMMPEHHAAAHGKDGGSLSDHMRQIAEDKGKKPPLGSGERFAAIEAHARASGARNPAAVAAAAGIKAHGKKRMAQMAAAGRKRAAKARK